MSTALFRAVKAWGAWAVFLSGLSPLPALGGDCPLVVNEEHPLRIKVTVNRGGAGAVWLDVTYEYYYGEGPNREPLGPCGRRWCDLGVDGGTYGQVCADELGGYPTFESRSATLVLVPRFRDNPYFAQAWGWGQAHVCSSVPPILCLDVTVGAPPPPPPPPRAGSEWHSFFAVDPRETPYVGDFNGDGRSDIITFTRDNPSAVGDVYVALSDGARFGPGVKWSDWFAVNQDERVVIGDFDGDGDDDIGTWLRTTSKQVYVALSTRSGMTGAQVWATSIGTSPGDVILAGDADGNGRDDLVAFARTEGKVYVALSTGSAFQPPAVWHNFFAVSSYERPRVADLNADGRVDIVAFASNSPTAQGDVYVALSGGAQFGDRHNSQKWHDWFAVSPDEEPAVGDRNGDKKDDFFTFLGPARGGQCYTADSTGSSMEPSRLWPEAAIRSEESDKAAVGDVNGDRRADIVIFAQRAGKVYVSLGR